MSRIYTGFNALALGQSINNLHNGIHQQRMNGLDVLSRSVQDLLDKKAEQNKAAAQRKSAIDYLTGNGMDEAKASQMVDTITPEQAVLYLTGRLDKQADTKSEHEYEQSIYDRNRSDKIADRSAQWGREDLIDKRNRGYSVLDNTFNALNERLNLLNMKAQEGTFPSQNHLEAIRRAENDLNEFIKAHPEYAARTQSEGEAQGEVTPDDSEIYFDSDAAPMTMERATRRISSVFDENDNVASEDLDSIDKEFIRNYGRSIYDIPELKSLVELATINQTGNKLNRLAANTKSGGTNTKYDNILKRDQDYETKMLNAYLAEYTKWAKDKTGKIKKPYIPEKYLKKMPKKYQNAYRRY